MPVTINEAEWTSKLRVQSFAYLSRFCYINKLQHYATVSSLKADNWSPGQMGQQM